MLELKSAWFNLCEAIGMWCAIAYFIFVGLVVLGLIAGMVYNAVNTYRHIKKPLFIIAKPELFTSAINICDKDTVLMSALTFTNPTITLLPKGEIPGPVPHYKRKMIKVRTPLIKTRR